MTYRTRRYMKRGGKLPLAFRYSRWKGSLYLGAYQPTPSLIKAKSKRKIVQPIEFWLPSVPKKPLRRIKLVTIKMKYKTKLL